MARKGLTEIVLVVDRSGSMGIIRDDAIGGLNTFIEDQQAVMGEANLTTVLFDNEYIIFHENVDIKEVEPFTKETYKPRNTTALHDAICRTANDVGKRLANTPERNRPEKVLFVILTDGYENASVTFNKQDVIDMIDHQREKYNWEFAFLAANQDAFAEGGSYHISQDACLNFATTSAGVKSMVGSLACYTTSYRTGGAPPVWNLNTSDDKAKSGTKTGGAGGKK